MDEALTIALDWHAEGRDVALATVLETWGSAPRPAGSVMAIDGAGAFAGSVSGGCVETAVVTEARDVLAGGEARVLEFGVADEEAWEVGLPCGGRIRVGLEHLDDATAAVVARAAEECHRGVPVVLVSEPGRAGRWLVRPAHVVGAPESDPPGPDRSAPTLLEATPDAGALPDAVSGETDSAGRLDRSGLRSVGDRDYFLQVLSPPLRMILVGAVHIAQALAPMARRAGFAVTVVDPRRAFASPERFPGVDLRVEWPDAALPDLRPDARTAVVVLAHDPKLDDPALRAALETPAYYIGALGSRRTQAARRQRLGEAGIQDDALDRIHGPVGLDLGGRAPAEIAVAILAEAIAVLRRPPEASSAEPRRSRL